MKQIDTGEKYYIISEKIIARLDERCNQLKGLLLDIFYNHEIPDYDSVKQDSKEERYVF